MLKKIESQLRLLANKLLVSTRRFPETLLLSTATVVILIYMNHLDYDNRALRDNLSRMAMVLALGLPLSLTIRLFIERRGDLGRKIRLALYGAGGIFLTLYYLILLRTINHISVSKYIGFTLSLYLIFSLIPYFYKRENYDFYLVTLFIRFVTTYLYATILFLGLVAIIGTINILFTINIRSTIYLDLWLIVVGIFGPGFFLADIPTYGQSLNIGDYSKVLKILLLYIIMPLMLIYSCILYIYFIKILVSSQWPEGILANLVLWFSILSTIVVFFISPLREENQWAKTFISFFPKIIIPLLLMMFISLGIRIRAYGITENRYYVLVVGLWVTACMVYYSINKSFRNILVTMSLAIISVMAVIGPWSALSVSKYSQNKRFQNLLKTNNMVSNENIIRPSAKLSKEDRREISSILSYFQQGDRLTDLKYLPDDFQIDHMPDVFGFEFEEDYWGPLKNKYFSHASVAEGEFINIKDYDFFFDYSQFINRDRGPKDSSQPIFVAYNEEDGILEIMDRDRLVYSRNIGDIAKIIHKNNAGNYEASIEKMSYLDRTSSMEVLYVFNHISGMEDYEGEITIHPPNFYMFIRLD